jgi:hypothetical protein
MGYSSSSNGSSFCHCSLVLAELRKRNTKAKTTICDAVRDHVIPHLIGKDFAFEMWASLCKLY